jgi:hypothetical protein
MPYNPILVPNRIHKLFHNLTLVGSLNVVSCIIIRVAFFLHCTIFKYDKFKTQFLIKQALSTLGVKNLGLHMH